jgi:hypothetical protein
MVLGGGASLLYFAAPSIALAGQCEALLLTCMDYRFPEKIVAYMNNVQRLQGNYDHVVLAGASLGVLTDEQVVKMPDWAPTFWAHLDVAINEHHIKRALVIDHWTCAAYPLLLKRPETRESHDHMLRKLGGLITDKTKLPVFLGLMEVDGTVHEVSPRRKAA